MNRQDIQQRWDECTIRAQRRWSRLTTSECTQCGGDFDKLATKIQASYDLTRDEADRQLEEFAQTLRLDGNGRVTHPADPTRPGVDQNFRLPTTAELRATYAPLPTASTPPAWQNPQSQPTPEQVAQARDTRPAPDATRPSLSPKDPDTKAPPPGPEALAHATPSLEVRAPGGVRHGTKTEKARPPTSPVTTPRPGSDA